MKDYTLIFIHGWGVKKETMCPLVNYLEKYYKCINLDILPLSKEKTYTINDYVLDLHEKIKQYDNIILIGHSFGGKIISFYALKYPVSKLVLIAPSTYIRRSLKTHIKILLYKACKRFRLQINFASNDYKKLELKEKQTFKNILINMHKKDLKNLTIPILLIGFKNDQEVKLKNIYFLHHKLKNSYLKIYIGNHFAYFDHLNKVLFDIYDFIIS